MKKYEHRMDEQIARNSAVRIANMAGEDGWELVAVVQSESRAHCVDLYYKRAVVTRHNISQHDSVNLHTMLQPVPSPYTAQLPH